MELEMDTTKQRINTATALYVTVNKLLYMLMYKTSTTSTINEIERILNIVKKSTIQIRPNRDIMIELD